MAISNTEKSFNTTLMLSVNPYQYYAKERKQIHAMKADLRTVLTIVELLYLLTKLLPPVTIFKDRQSGRV